MLLWIYNPAPYSYVARVGGVGERGAENGSEWAVPRLGRKQHNPLWRHISLCDAPVPAQQPVMYAHQRAPGHSVRALASESSIPRPSPSLAYGTPAQHLFSLHDHSPFVPICLAYRFHCQPAGDQMTFWSGKTFLYASRSTAFPLSCIALYTVSCVHSVLAPRSPTMFFSIRHPYISHLRDPKRARSRARSK